MTSYLVSDHEFASPQATATFLPLDQFLRQATSEEGLTCDTIFVDFNAIDEEVYGMLIEADADIKFVRDQKSTPEFVAAEVEDWSAKASAKERLSQANGLFHKFVLDKRPGFFIAILIATVALMLVVSMNYRALPSIVFIIVSFATIILFVYGIGGLVLRTIYAAAAKVGGRCDQCQQWGAVKKGRKEVLGTEAISIKKTLENKNTRGEVISTSEQYIPGTRTFYRQWYLCSKCGHESYKDSYRDVASV